MRPPESRTIPTPVASSTWTFSVDPFDSDNIVLTNDAVRDGNLWSTSDGGETWRTHDIAIESPEIPWLERTDLTSFMSAGRLMFDPSVRGRLWFAEGMGVWVADDLDADEVVWTSTARGIEELVVSSIITPPGGLPLVSVADRQGFALEGRGRYPAQTLIDARFASGSRLEYSGGAPEVVAWVGAESHLANSPDRTSRGAVSVDGGRTWIEMEGLVPEMYGGEVAVSATDPGTIVWLPTYSTSPLAFQSDPVGLFVSRDGGASWNRTNVDGDVHSFHRFFWWFTRTSLAADRVNSNFYLMSDEERFYVSSDGASTWDRSTYAPPCSVEVDCHVFGQVRANPSVAGEVWASTARGGLHRSSTPANTPWDRLPGLSRGASLCVRCPPTRFGRARDLRPWASIQRHPAGHPSVDGQRLDVGACCRMNRMIWRWESTHSQRISKCPVVSTSASLVQESSSGRTRSGSESGAASAPDHVVSAARSRTRFVGMAIVGAAIVASCSNGDEPVDQTFEPLDAEDCIVWLHGKGERGADSSVVDGIGQVAPTGNGTAGDGSEWLYFPDDRYDEAMQIVSGAVDDSECEVVAIGGFSNGAAFAGTIFCSGETLGGRLVGVVVDDPPPDMGTQDCAPAEGVEVALYWTGALDEQAVEGTQCDSIGWTCLGGELVGIDRYAQALGAPITDSPFDEHLWYRDAPEFQSWLG